MQYEFSLADTLSLSLSLSLSVNGQILGESIFFSVDQNQHVIFTNENNYFSVGVFEEEKNCEHNSFV